MPIPHQQGPHPRAQDPKPRVYVLCGALLAALASAPAVATAQEASEPQGAVSLSRFDPSPAGDRLFGVPSPYVAGHVIPHAMLLVDYAHNPLVLRRESDDSSLGAVVGGQLTMHLNVTVPLWDRLAVNVDAPLTLVQTGDDPSGGGVTYTSPTDGAFGDLRLGLRVRLLGEYYDPLQLAVGAALWVPTGPDDAYLGDGGVRGMPQVIAGGRTEQIVWSAALGGDFRGSHTVAGVAQGTMLTLGGGLGFLLAEQKLQVGPELSASFVLEDVSAQTVNAELLAGARYRLLPVLEAGLAVGPGLTGGIGTPDVRVVGSVAFTPEQPRPSNDRDGDRVLDVEDACPYEPGVRSLDPRKNGCPPPADRDRDGIGDPDDACPLARGVAHPDPRKNGCPPPADRDKDGIIDANDACPLLAGATHPDRLKNGCPPDKDNDAVPDLQDACPDVRGVLSDDPSENGCPPDSDGDGLRDDIDACPKEKGAADPDATKSGCPKSVRVTETEVVILQQVQFDTNRASIQVVSDPLLDEVAGVLKEHPEITLLEVQGHTDNRGSRHRNNELSQSRAEAVVAAMVKRGIDPTRLRAKGYGRDRPIDDNATEAGRQNNRRVQFKILEKAATEGKAEEKR